MDSSVPSFGACSPVFQPDQRDPPYSCRSGQSFLGQPGSLPERPDPCAQDLPPQGGHYFHPGPVGVVAVMPDEVPGKFHLFILQRRQYYFVGVRQFDGIEVGVVSNLWNVLERNCPLGTVCEGSVDAFACQGQLR